MAKVIVYDKDNKEHSKEPVDARECCENLGWSMEKIVEEVKETAKDKKARLALEKQELDAK